ncbi:uncharacterized protein LOC116618161 [Nematostella vectensis]|uniref:uncharacterized protein LOC116618161 n=1 Tax=Nematostella vectensis TaxID=45351 RepID=UPI002076E8FE|nr:uncharacterized protein LOC116618161 [Nematostella vectensis]
MEVHPLENAKHQSLYRETSSNGESSLLYSTLDSRNTDWSIMGSHSCQSDPGVYVKYQVVGPMRAGKTSHMALAVENDMTSSTVTIGNTNHPSRGFTMNEPDDYFGPAILSTMICCPVLGVVAVTFSIKVILSCKRRDYERATTFSKCAKIWTLAAIVAGFITIIFCVVYLKLLK